VETDIAGSDPMKGTHRKRWDTGEQKWVRFWAFGASSDLQDFVDLVESEWVDEHFSALRIGFVRYILIVLRGGGFSFRD
jgi:hypothetical protein